MDRFIHEQLLSGKNDISFDYFTAAQYLLYQRQDLQKALLLAERSLQFDKYEGDPREIVKVL